MLNVILREQIVDDERLSTLFCEVESIVNGRPLTVLSHDPNDETPLKPNHLLLLRGGPHLFPTQFDWSDIYGRRWRHVQFLSDQFWKRWVRKCLTTLQLRQKWLRPKRNLQNGDVVLIRNERIGLRDEWTGRASGTNHSDFPRKGRISQNGPSEDQLVDPDQAYNQVVPFGVFRWRDVNLYALRDTLYTGLVLSRNSY